MDATNNMLALWLALGVFLLMIEMFTGTLYGLSLSIAAFVLAIYVYYTGEMNFTLVQAIILFVLSSVLCYFFPKWFNQSEKGDFNGSVLDRAVGSVLPLKESKGIYRVNIEGVDYLVDEDSVTKDFAKGKKAVINSHDGSTVQVSIM